MSAPKPQYVRPGGKESLYPVRGGAWEVVTEPQPDPDALSTYVYNRHHHLPFAAQRIKLPVFEHRSHILYLLERYQTLVLAGETGSGKSTQVPQYVFEVGHRVCVTQPRAAAAVALAARVADERGEGVGDRVGYAVGMDSRRSEATDIVFMTEGVLLREMFASPLLTQYSCVVLDEVHERSLLTDVLMGLLKKIARKRKNLKLIISSATMDSDYLRDFFNVNSSGESSAVAMAVQGRAHPIDLFNLQEPTANYVQATVETIIKIHENKPFGDILAFLTSQEEVVTALEAVETYAADNNARNEHRRTFPSGIAAHHMSVLPMYGSLPHYKQLKVFQMADKNVRKVVIATNIAETSITVPGISYVIDCGFHKLPYFEPAVGVPSLAVCAISRANAAQRAGRAGRTARGECYRLYTEAEFDKMTASVPPEMQRSDLSSMVLQLKALGIHNILRFPFPTSPPVRTVVAALQQLLALGALGRGGELTQPLGQNMAELPLPPTTARILCGSGEYGCIEEALSIVAMLQVDGVFLKIKSSQQSAKARVYRRNNFEVAEGDVLTYLNVYEAYARVAVKTDATDKQREKASRDWCTRMYLNHHAMEKVAEMRKSLEKLVKYDFQLMDKNFEGLEFGAAKSERVLRCVTSGLFPHACYLNTRGTYSSVAGDRDVDLHIAGDSCLHGETPPQWVVYHTVQTSRGKLCMRGVTAIKKEWLLEVAPHFYRQT